MNPKIYVFFLNGPTVQYHGLNYFKFFVHVVKDVYKYKNIYQMHLHSSRALQLYLLSTIVRLV